MANPYRDIEQGISCLHPNMTSDTVHFHCPDCDLFYDDNEFGYHSEFPEGEQWVDAIFEVVSIDGKNLEVIDKTPFINDVDMGEQK